MNRAFKTEFYPDMTDKEYGKKVVTLSCAVNNGKRFKNLSDDEREILIELITVFQESLSQFKKEIYKQSKQVNNG